MLDIAFTLVVPVVLGYFIGHYFDNLQHLSFPVWSITGVILGVITGMWSVYKRYIR